ncbi:MAG: AraC family transcriptional regulator [Treponema sp.]|jgi:AraC-like DNA-binding protein|nr:AraC family transcriptional regulator [Treponema sp.]
MHLPFYEKEKLDPAFPFLAWERLKPSFWFPLHWHAQVELVHILSGGLDVIISGKSRRGRRGDIVMVDTGLIHGFSNPDPETGVRIFQFGLEIFSRALSEVQAGAAAPVFSHLPLLRCGDGVVHSRLERLLDELFSEYQRRDSGYRLSVIAKLYEFTVTLLRDMPARQPSPGKDESGGEKADGGVRLKHNLDRLDRVFAFIAGNFDNPKLSLEMTAEKACLNKSYFSRFLKEQTGQTFYEYLSRVRIRQAEQYLMESDMSVTEIAYCCGFNSIATFNRLFKTYMGLSPTAYRGGKDP